MVEQIKEYRIQLCEITGPVASALSVDHENCGRMFADIIRYGNAQISTAALRELSDGTISALDTWKRQLPRTFCFDQDGDHSTMPQLLAMQ